STVPQNSATLPRRRCPLAPTGRRSNITVVTTTTQALFTPVYQGHHQGGDRPSHRSDNLVSVCRHSIWPEAYRTSGVVWLVPAASVSSAQVKTLHI
ncbi:MAG: hypothetical protein AAFY20_27610, partial [Cyanobacteria bacterium J06639_14]